MAEKQESGASNADRQLKSNFVDGIHINEVGGDVLAEASLKQKPKLWTKRMFKVSPLLTLNFNTNSCYRSSTCVSL
jgi:hypothetical protein